MNDVDELDLRVARWVADLPSRAPDETLDRVLAELPTLPQHGRLLGAFGRSLMHTSAGGRRASFALSLAAAAAVVAVAVGAGVLVNRGSSSGGIGGPPTTPSATALLPSASSGAGASIRLPELTTIDVGGPPLGVDAGEDAVWVTAGNGTVRIDLRTNETARVDLPSGTNGIRVTEDAVWVSGYPSRNVYRIDPESRELVDTIELDAPPYALEPLDDRLLVAFESRTQLIAMNTGETVREIDLPGAFPYPVAFGSLWVAGGTVVHRLDPVTGATEARIDVPLPADTCTIWPLSGVTGIDDSLVLGCFGGEHLTRIDVGTNHVVGTYRLGENGGSAVAANGGWWSPVGPVEDGGFARIDPVTGTIADRIDLGEGNSPAGMVTTANDLWIAAENANRVLRVPFTSLQAP